MKITDVRATTVAIPLEAPLRYAQGVHPGRLIRTLVEVDTDEGVTGLGEIGGSGASSDALIAALRDRLLGHDPMRPEHLRWVAYNPVEGAFYEDLTQGFAAVEFACLDIQGKVTGRPVHELLGGAVRPRVEFAAYIFFRYATDSAGPVSTPAQVTGHARELVEQYGFRTIKVKGGVFRPEHEIEVMRSLREAFPGSPLRLDPNSNWSVDESIRHARPLEEIALEYYEDPCWGLAGMARLRQRTWLPLATNTYVTRLDHLAPAVRDAARRVGHARARVRGRRSLSPHDRRCHRGRQDAVPRRRHRSPHRAWPGSGARPGPRRPLPRALPEARAVPLYLRPAAHRLDPDDS
jgi:glucarate dehydratase